MMNCNPLNSRPLRRGIHGRWQVRVSAAAVAGVAAAVLFSVPVSHAVADTAPDPGVPATVAADALPTVQQNGVVWSAVIVGNTAYATGSFTETWPAGTSNTAANWTPRNNLLAFDITTGNLITSFNHSLNAQGLTITASPDGSRLYVGGDFTAVDGQTRNHIAAFDTATGALATTFRPSLSAQVAALAATQHHGLRRRQLLQATAGIPRTRLAAFNAADGTLLPLGAQGR